MAGAHFDFHRCPNGNLCSFFMFSFTNKPRFALDLALNELTNIPHVSGSCFVDINIRDRRRAKFLLKLGLGLALALALTAKLNSKHARADKAAHTLTTPGTVLAVTLKRRIHNFKCAFNYRIRCNLKFPLKKKQNLIGNKYLVMVVYYVGETRGDGDGDGDRGGSLLELGRLEINLLEYLNFEEPTTSKYLLRQSKINSIFSLTILLRELPADMEFHTQLQIADAPLAPTLAPSLAPSLASSRAPSRAPSLASLGPAPLRTRQPQSHASRFNVPNFERSKVFGGLNDVIKTPTHDRDDGDDASAATASATTSATASPVATEEHHRNGKRTMQHIASHLYPHHNNSGVTAPPDAHNKNIVADRHRDSAILMQPIVSNLYKKILEASWDPELYKLMDFSPEKVVESIFRDGTAANDRFMKTFDPWRGEELDAERDLNGLINEVGYRDNLKSWNSKK